MGGTISQPWMLYEVCTFLPRDERTPFFQLCKYLASMTVKPAHHRWLCRQLARESLIYGKTKGECVYAMGAHVRVIHQSLSGASIPAASRSLARW